MVLGTPQGQGQLQSPGQSKEMPRIPGLVTVGAPGKLGNVPPTPHH